MIKVDSEYKNLIVAMLTDAFKDNQSVTYLVQQDEKRLKRISALMDYSFETCTDFGEAWVSENHQACALILFPHLKNNSDQSSSINLLVIG